MLFQKRPATWRAVMVGHLRERKVASGLVSSGSSDHARPKEILIDHIGQALDPELGDMAAQTARECPHYRGPGGVTQCAGQGPLFSAPMFWFTPVVLKGAPMSFLEAIC
jgi:hypothetical protein